MNIKPQPLHESDYSDMEEQLRELFYELVFSPILEILNPHNAQVRAAAKELKNAATSTVVAALRAGKIQYDDGVFSGDFNARISKELSGMGAKWNKQSKVFSLAANLLPPDVASMATEYNETAKLMHRRLDERLAEMEAGLSGRVAAADIDAEMTVGKVQKGFEKSAGKVLGADADLDEAGKARLSAEYTESIKPYVQKFSEDMIAELRRAVADNASEGYRFDRLIDRIEGRYDVTQTKAAFLARQETALLVSKHRQVRFEDAGVTRYIWRTAGDSRVRKDHDHLDGREFLYSQPPIIDRATGQRGNPGQGFNCRCVDEPVLPEVVAA